jgi:hypothetical protein
MWQRGAWKIIAEIGLATGIAVDRLVAPGDGGTDIALVQGFERLLHELRME